jgi:protein-tyrosine kinase
MVKISEALEKAGCHEGVQLAMENSAQELPEALSSSPLPPHSPPIIEKSEPTKGLIGKWEERLFRAVNDDNDLPEMFKVFRSRILHPKDGRAVPKTIMITSATPKEGKSFITANLGISLAQGIDQHSLLVDCDLRRPSLAGLFGIKTNVGLVDYLRDEMRLSDLICKTALEKLSVLPSGKPPLNPSELLSSTRMLALVEELSSRYEDRIIFFDTPPALVAAETSVLAGQVDAVILVVRQGGAGRGEVQQLINRIGAEQIFGIVFNDWNTNAFEKTLFKGYGNYYHSYNI